MAHLACLPRRQTRSEVRWITDLSERLCCADCVEEVRREVNRKSRGRGLAIGDKARCLKLLWTKPVAGSAWPACGGFGRWRQGGIRRAHRLARAVAADQASEYASNARTASRSSFVRAVRWHKPQWLQCRAPYHEHLRGGSAGSCGRARWDSTAASAHSHRSPACWRDSASCRCHRQKGAAVGKSFGAA